MEIRRGLGAHRDLLVVRRDRRLVCRARRTATTEGRLEGGGSFVAVVVVALVVVVVVVATTALAALSALAALTAAAAIAATAVSTLATARLGTRARFARTPPSLGRLRFTATGPRVGGRVDETTVVLCCVRVRRCLPPEVEAAYAAGRERNDHDHSRCPASRRHDAMLASRAVTAVKIRVCFVCSGNICRSPTAEGVFKQLVAEAGLAHAFDVESAGIGNWHVGERPDPRTVRAAEKRGYRLESRAQQWKVRDFDRFDYVVAMDRTHVHSLIRLATTEPMKAKISLARDHVQGGPRDADVPESLLRRARGVRRGRRHLPRGLRGAPRRDTPEARAVTSAATFAKTLDAALGSRPRDASSSAPSAGVVELCDGRRVFVKAPRD